MSLSGVSAVSISASIRSFSQRLIGIFIPLYIFTLVRGLPGMNLKFALLAVLLYDFIRLATALVLDIPVARAIKRLGYRQSIMLSAVLEAAVLLILVFSRFEPRLIFLAALVAGARIGFYFQSYHAILAADGSWRSFGETLGKIETWVRLIGSLGPLIGGLVADHFGFAALFGAGVFFLAFSVVPYLLMPHHCHDGELSLARVDRLAHEYPGLVTVFIGSAVNVQSRGFVYPIFVLVVVGTLTRAGGLISISLFVSSLLWWLTGRAMDRHAGDERFVELSLSAQIFVWLARGVVRTPGRVLAADVFEKASLPFGKLPMFEAVYRLGKPNPHIFVLFREFLTHLGGLIGVLLLMIIIQAAFSWQAVFLVPALGSLLVIWGMRRVPREALE
jgi:hypothetical protein